MKIYATLWTFWFSPHEKPIEFRLFPRHFSFHRVILAFPSKIKRQIIKCIIPNSFVKGFVSFFKVFLCFWLFFLEGRGWGAPKWFHEWTWISGNYEGFSVFVMRCPFDLFWCTYSGEDGYSGHMVPEKLASFEKVCCLKDFLLRSSKLKKGISHNSSSITEKDDSFLP